MHHFIFLICCLHYYIQDLDTPIFLCKLIGVSSKNFREKMANPMDRIAMLEADNRRLRIRIRELEDRVKQELCDQLIHLYIHVQEEERIRRNESLLHNVMENVEGIRYTGNNHAPSQGLVNDLIAQTETQRDKVFLLSYNQRVVIWEVMRFKQIVKIFMNELNLSSHSIQ